MSLRSEVGWEGGGGGGWSCVDRKSVSLQAFLDSRFHRHFLCHFQSSKPIWTFRFLALNVVASGT